MKNKVHINGDHFDEKENAQILNSSIFSFTEYIFYSIDLN